MKPEADLAGDSDDEYEVAQEGLQMSVRSCKDISASLLGSNAQKTAPVFSAPGNNTVFYGHMPAVHYITDERRHQLEAQLA